MEKLKMKTESKVDKNIEAIGTILPNTLTEIIKGYDIQGKPIIEHAIDFDLLRQELSKVIVEGKEERYQMNWPGKKEAILKANVPINMTLRPCREESVDFDKTENLYIEGDNLEVLKLLQETYLNRVKMIYIDPPYNTGNDSFVYNDDFTMSSEEFSDVSGQYDKDGNMIYDIRKNNESNGKFHTDWLNMMYPRLKLARDLLRDDGVIFISIDDNEVNNLKKICDEIFGEVNYVETLKWKKKKQPSFLAKHTAKVMEYILVYAKVKNDLEKLSIEGTTDSTKKVINISNNESVRHFKKGVRVKGEENQVIMAGRYKIKTMEIEYKNNIVVEDGYTQNEVDVVARFSVSQEKINNYIQEKLLFITAQKGLRRAVSTEEIGKRKSITDLLLSEWGDNQESDKEFIDLFGKKIFEYNKPIKLIKNLIKCNHTEEDIVCDFFSGSATTAHAVMQLNAEDGGNRKFIMIQFPELTEENSEAFKDGYKNICELGKMRIKKAGKKIKEENPDKTDTLDTGFRVLKSDSSNMKDIYYNPNDINQNMIDKLESNIKEDRSSEDLLFQVMLDLGQLLSSNIEEIEIAGKNVFNVGQGSIIACFDDNITNEVVTAIAKIKPSYAVFRDSSLISDAVATNFEQIFKTYSPNTIRKIL